ncbi:hypothetical protein K493DRAFT_238417, partial [Basidiobolus meristosporus CBS 931.73]
LLASLIHIALSTGGCLTWRHDAIMTTTRHEIDSFPTVFKGQHIHTRHYRAVMLYQLSNPSSNYFNVRAISC